MWDESLNYLPNTDVNSHKEKSHLFNIIVTVSFQIKCIEVQKQHNKNISLS